MPPEPKLRVLVVDDEPLVRSGIVADCAAIGGVDVVGEAQDGGTAVQQIERLRPELVLLDVQMPGIDGFEVLAQFDAAERPAVVFVTAHDRYALRAFEVHAVDYLLKPFDRDRLRTALARAAERLRTPQAGQAVDGMLDAVVPRRLDRFVVRHGGRLRTVAIADVEWIEARGNYVHLHTPDGPFLLRHTLAALEEALVPAGFLRVHRSALVALAAVRDWQRDDAGDYEVRMSSGTKVTMSRSHREAFERAMGARR